MASPPPSASSAAGGKSPAQLADLLAQALRDVEQANAQRDTANARAQRAESLLQSTSSPSPSNIDTLQAKIEQLQRTVNDLTTRLRHFEGAVVNYDRWQQLAESRLLDSRRAFTAVCAAVARGEYVADPHYPDISSWAPPPSRARSQQSFSVPPPGAPGGPPIAHASVPASLPPVPSTAGTTRTRTDRNSDDPDAQNSDIERARKRLRSDAGPRFTHSPQPQPLQSPSLPTYPPNYKHHRNSDNAHHHRTSQDSMVTPISAITAVSSTSTSYPPPYPRPFAREERTSSMISDIMGSGVRSDSPPAIDSVLPNSAGLHRPASGYSRTPPPGLTEDMKRRDRERQFTSESTGEHKDRHIEDDDLAETQQESQSPMHRVEYGSKILSKSPTFSRIPHTQAGRDHRLTEDDDKNSVDRFLLDSAIDAQDDEDDRDPGSGRSKPAVPVSPRSRIRSRADSFAGGSGMVDQDESQRWKERDRQREREMIARGELRSPTESNGYPHPHQPSSHHQQQHFQHVNGLIKTKERAGDRNDRFRHYSTPSIQPHSAGMDPTRHSFGGSDRSPYTSHPATPVHAYTVPQPSYSQPPSAGSMTTTFSVSTHRRGNSGVIDDPTRRGGASSHGRKHSLSLSTLDIASPPATSTGQVTTTVTTLSTNTLPQGATTSVLFPHSQPRHTGPGPAVKPALNAQGQRTCRQCHQPGRYKDGKCVEKWGPGPEGPGTVCDRCRKKMKRVERRGTLEAANLAAQMAANPPTGVQIAARPQQSFSGATQHRDSLAGQNVTTSPPIDYHQSHPSHREFHFQPPNVSGPGGPGGGQSWGRIVGGKEWDHPATPSGHARRDSGSGSAGSPLAATNTVAGKKRRTPTFSPTPSPEPIRRKGDGEGRTSRKSSSGNTMSVMESAAVDLENELTGGSGSVTSPAVTAVATTAHGPGSIKDAGTGGEEEDEVEEDADGDAEAEAEDDALGEEDHPIVQSPASHPRASDTSKKPSRTSSLSSSPPLAGSRGSAHSQTQGLSKQSQPGWVKLEEDGVLVR
ncbi:hypothetical protein FRC03_009236 [Tulasnella sp. 419]|nr:hypothetical protein FRC03_009236 [Tulasnella sp. 419]